MQVVSRLALTQSQRSPAARQYRNLHKPGQDEILPLQACLLSRHCSLDSLGSVNAISFAAGLVEQLALASSASLPPGRQIMVF